MEGALEDVIGVVETQHRGTRSRSSEVVGQLTCRHIYRIFVQCSFGNPNWA